MALPVAVGGGSPAVANTNAASSIGVSVAQVATGEPTGCSPHVVSLSRGDVRCHHNKILTWWSLFLVLCQPGPVPTRPAPVALVRSSRVSPRLVSLSETLSRGDADCHRDQMLTDVAVAPLRCPLPFDAALTSSAVQEEHVTATSARRSVGAKSVANRNRATTPPHRACFVSPTPFSPSSILTLKYLETRPASKRNTSTNPRLVVYGVGLQRHADDRNSAR